MFNSYRTNYKTAEATSVSLRHPHTPPHTHPYIHTRSCLIEIAGEWCWTITLCIFQGLWKQLAGQMPSDKFSEAVLWQKNSIETGWLFIELFAKGVFWRPGVFECIGCAQENTDVMSHVTLDLFHFRCVCVTSQLNCSLPVQSSTSVSRCNLCVCVNCQHGRCWGGWHHPSPLAALASCCILQTNWEHQTSIHTYIKLY